MPRGVYGVFFVPNVRLDAWGDSTWVWRERCGLCAWWRWGVAMMGRAWGMAIFGFGHVVCMRIGRKREGRVSDRLMMGGRLGWVFG